MIEENLNQREGQPKPNSAGLTGGGAVLGVTPCSAYWVLFDHMQAEYGLALLDQQLADIAAAVDDMRNRWLDRIDEAIVDADGTAEQTVARIRKILEQNAEVTHPASKP